MCSGDCIYFEKSDDRYICYQGMKGYFNKPTLCPKFNDGIPTKKEEESNGKD